MWVKRKALRGKRSLRPLFSQSRGAVNSLKFPLIREPGGGAGAPFWWLCRAAHLLKHKILPQLFRAILPEKKENSEALHREKGLT